MPDDPSLESIKLPPHSLEAEQSVLGGLLLDNDAADRVGDILADADFYSEAHRLIYQHIVRLIADAQPADVVTVSEALGSAQKLDYVGGLAYLGALVQNVPTAANIRQSCASSPPPPATSPTRRTTRWAAAPRRSSTRPRPRSCTSPSRARAASSSSR
ncbi:MAG: helicase [Acidobacteria bacterium]|nr:helicase [Acidobacteriota bacterium]